MFRRDTGKTHEILEPSDGEHRQQGSMGAPGYDHGARDHPESLLLMLANYSSLEYTLSMHDHRGEK